MIALGPVTSSAGTVYTAAQVLAMLLGPSLEMRWLFDLLGPDLTYKADLTPLVQAGSPQISHDSTRAVKRVLTLTMRASSGVNVLQDLVRVRYEVLAPDGGWLDWQIGLFMLTPPAKAIHEGYTLWTITAPDLSQLLVDAAFSGATAFQAGSDRAASVRQLVSGYGGRTPLSAVIPGWSTTLPASMGWNAGDSRLKAVNDLLAADNYTNAWMSGALLTSKPVPDFTQVTPVLTLDAVAGQAQIFGPLAEVPDYANAFNQFLVTGQDPRQQPVSAPPYENRRPDSPVSLVNWHPRLKVINDSSLPDAGACAVRARIEAQTSARILSALTVGTVPFPFFEDLDVVALAYQSADEGVVRANYLVIAGTHTCAAGAPTMGTLQRLVAA